MSIFAASALREDVAFPSCDDAQEPHLARNDLGRITGCGRTAMYAIETRDYQMMPDFSKVNGKEFVDSSDYDEQTRAARS